MATQSTLSSLAFDHRSYKKYFETIERTTLKLLIRAVKSYTIFNILFLFLGLGECTLFLLFFNLLTQSTLLAFTLAVILSTCFSYFILRIYLKAKKTTQLESLCQEYLYDLKKTIAYQHGNLEHHITIADTLSNFALQLQDLEYTLYQPPEGLSTLAPTLEKFSCWCHWQDVHDLKETLLNGAIKEQIDLIKQEPTGLEWHAALANTYVLLSSIYSNPMKNDSFDEERWIPPERLSQEMLQKFRQIAKRAIEEFNILNNYAPDDPWIHAQLAYSYHDLQMPIEEIQEYELILKLKPHDEESRYKLGILYFQQGMNAKGLKVYETLQQINSEKASQLIAYYGAYLPSYETFSDDLEHTLSHDTDK